MNAALATSSVSERELLVIERLAAALEKAASVDEIKDVRDRAQAIQLYARKKAGGLEAAQSAGRIVTDATVMLARLYAEETEAKPGPKKQLADHDPVIDRPGKEAIAKAADMDSSALRRMAPAVEASKAVVKTAMKAIEERGDVVTPTALVREIKHGPPKAKKMREPLPEGWVKDDPNEWRPDAFMSQATIQIAEWFEEWRKHEKTPKRLLSRLRSALNLEEKVDE